MYNSFGSFVNPKYYLKLAHANAQLMLVNK